MSEQAYWQSYGLQQDPFEQDDIYPIPQWSDTVELLAHLSQYSNKLMLIVGDIDSGKSTLLQQFMSTVDQDIEIRSFEASPKLTAEGFDHAVRQSFNLPFHGHLLENFQHQEATSIFAIDNAELLIDEVLTQMVSLVKEQNADEAPLHFMLFMEPDALSRIQAVASQYLEADLIHTIVLQPFEQAQTQAYLEYAFQQAGLSGPFPLSKSDVSKIQKLSDGYIGRVKQVTRQLIRGEGGGASFKAPMKSCRPHMMVATGLFAFIFVMVAGLTFWGLDTTYDTQAKLTLPTLKPKKFVVEQPKAATEEPEMTASSWPPIHRNKTQQAIHNVAKHVKKLYPASIKQAMPLKVLAHNEHSSTPAPSIAPVKPNVHLPSDAHVTARYLIGHQAIRKALNAKPLPLPGSEKTKKRAMLQSENLAAVPPQPVAVDSVIVMPDLRTKKPANKQAANKKQLSKSSLEVFKSLKRPAKKQIAKKTTIKKPTAKKKITHQKTVKPASTKTTRVKKEKPATTKPVAQQENPFALQLIASHNKQGAIAFIRRHKLQGKARTLKRRAKGQLWYVVVFGHYPSTAAAMKAVKQLPVSLQRLKPWPRRYGRLR
jgi:type II secretory pathway predicted ATPase ExeA